jgi:hypothetical protein
MPKGSLVWRTRLSGGAPDSVRCTRGPRAELLSLGIFLKPARYNSPDCPVYTGQCPVLQEDAASELGSFGNLQWLLRYNSSDMSSVHRTVRCNRGATATSRQRSPAGAFNARQKRAEVRHAHTGAPDIEQYIQAGPEVRTPTALVTWLAHRTCPVCTGLSRAPYDRQPPPTVMFGGWGYKYPNHPTIHCIQVFQLPTTIQELAFIAKHTKKRSNHLPTPHKALVTRESDL